VPLPVERAMIVPPTSRIGTISDAERATIRARSPVGGKYDTAVDRESAFEILTQRTNDTVVTNPATKRWRWQQPRPHRRSKAQARAGARWSAMSLLGSGRRQGVIETMAKIGDPQRRQPPRHGTRAAGVLGSLFAQIIEGLVPMQSCRHWIALIGLLCTWPLTNWAAPAAPCREYDGAEACHDKSTGRSHRRPAQRETNSNSSTQSAWESPARRTLSPQWSCCGIAFRTKNDGHKRNNARLLQMNCSMLILRPGFPAKRFVYMNRWSPVCRRL